MKTYTTTAREPSIYKKTQLIAIVFGPTVFITLLKRISIQFCKKYTGFLLRFFAAVFVPTVLEVEAVLEAAGQKTHAVP